MGVQVEPEYAIDDSGEDYLYPAKLFEQVDIRESTAERLHSIFNA